MRKIYWLIATSLMVLSVSAYALKVNGPLEGAIVEGLPADPTVGAVEGRIFWDTVLNKFRIHDGTSFTDVLIGSAAIPDPMLLNDGVVGAPTYSFTSEPTSGLYRSGAGQLTLSILGTARHYFAASFYQLQGTTTASLYVTPGVGNIANISMGSVGDLVDGRISYDNTSKLMTIRTNDISALSIDSSNVGKSTFISRLVVDNGEPDQPAYSSNIDFDTGMHFPAAGNISFSAIGANRFTIDSNAISSIEPMRLHNGAVSSASYGFTNDIDTGMSLASTGVLSFSAGGVSRLSVDTDSINGIEPIRMHSGAISGPSYSFSSDGDTGMYLQAAAVLGFSTAGVSRLTVDTTKIQSIEPFHGPTGSAAAPTFSFVGNTTDGMYSRSSSSLGFAVNGSENFLVGSTVNRSTLVFQSVYGDSTAPGYSFTSDTNSGMYYDAVINGPGLVFNGSVMFKVQNGAVRMRLDDSTYTTDLCASSTTGLVTVDNCSSSIRYKKNVIDIPDSDSSKLWDLRPVAFDWKESGETNYGFIAEEVHAVLPKLTYYNTSSNDAGAISVIKDANGDPEIEGVHYKHMTALLLAEMKKLKARIEILEGQ